MGDNSAIEWTTATWNPVVGCAAVSPGCDHCYAARDTAGRLKHVPVYEGLATKEPGQPAKFTGEVRCLPERLDQPLRWKRPRHIFVNSMSDLFHSDVPDGFVSQVFDVMDRSPQHTFQVLTKRPQRMGQLVRRFRTYGEEHGWFLNDSGYQAGLQRNFRNVWLGCSIESNHWAFRADHLRETPAAIRFLSLEPLLGPLPSLDLTGISWVIVGGESGGRNARPMHPAWVRDIRDRCVEAGVAFFFKQWGAWLPLDHREHLDLPPAQREWRRVDGEVTVRVGKKAAGRELDGRTWDQMPDRTEAR